MTHTQRRSIADILAELDTRDLTGDFARIARAHHVTLEELMGPRRTAAICGARHECFALLHGLGWATTSIGALFGRDHVTVIHGIRAHDRRIAKAFMVELRKGAA